MSSLGTPKCASRAIQSLNSSYLVVSLLALFFRNSEIFIQKKYVVSFTQKNNINNNNDCCQEGRWCQAGTRSGQLGLSHRRRGAEHMPGYSVKYPIRHGIVNDRDLMEKYW